MKKFTKEFIMINIGLAFLAAGIHFFLVPNNLAAGGVTELAMVISDYIPFLTTGPIILMLNAVLVVIGFIFIGKKFGIFTVYCSLIYPGMVWILEKVYPIKAPLTDDMFIELIFGVILSAIGLGVVFNQNTSTGGTDIIAKILNKYFNWDIGKALLLADFIITISAAYTFGAKKGMYALLGVILNGFIIDVVIDGMNICKKIEIVSCEGEKIKKFIIDELDRGATLYTAKGAYTGETKEVITTVIGKKEFVRLKNYIKEIDRKAFIMSYNVHETLGEGFKDIME